MFTFSERDLIPRRGILWHFETCGEDTPHSCLQQNIFEIHYYNFKARFMSDFWHKLLRDCCFCRVISCALLPGMIHEIFNFVCNFPIFLFVKKSFDYSINASYGAWFCIRYPLPHRNSIASCVLDLQANTNRFAKVPWVCLHLQSVNWSESTVEMFDNRW